MLSVLVRHHAKADMRYQIREVQVVLPSRTQLTPKVAREACRIAFGNTSGRMEVVGLGDTYYGYKVYPDSIRKFTF